MSDIIIGIDPGIASCGYGLIQWKEGQWQHLSHGVIRTTPDIPLPERLAQIHKELHEIFTQYQPNALGLEDLYFSKNAKTALTVGQVKGVIILTAIQAGIPMSIFTPLQVKQAVTSYGKAEKSQVQQMVKILLNIPEIPKPDDAADALAIAICCAHTAKMLQ